MYTMPIAATLAQGAAQEARSALPGAPVVPPRRSGPGGPTDA